MPDEQLIRRIVKVLGLGVDQGTGGSQRLVGHYRRSFALGAGITEKGVGPLRNSDIGYLPVIEPDLSKADIAQARNTGSGSRATLFTDKDAHLWEIVTFGFVGKFIIEDAQQNQVTRVTPKFQLSHDGTNAIFRSHERIWCRGRSISVAFVEEGSGSYDVIAYHFPELE